MRVRFQQPVYGESFYDHSIQDYRLRLRHTETRVGHVQGYVRGYSTTYAIVLYEGEFLELPLSDIHAVDEDF